MHSNPKSRLLIETISAALVEARGQHGWSMPMPAVNVSYTGDNYVLVHLTPLGVFGPYSRDQIPDAVITDVSKELATKPQPPTQQRVGRKASSVHALPAPLSIARLIADAAGSVSPAAPSAEDETQQRSRERC